MRSTSPIKVGTRSAVVVVTALVLIAGAACSAGNDADTAAGTTSITGVPVSDPRPPQIPQDFRWTGRYVVPDLDLEVPFTWNGNGGNFQMTAGGPDEEIWFTNLIDDGHLYTLTYTWPGVPRNPCSDLGPYTLDELNTGLAAARFVGAETLYDAETRDVYHYRVGLVWEPTTDEIPAFPGLPQIRIPLMAGDLYVDRDDPNKVWKVLQFGLGNIYDAQLDEWMVIDDIQAAPGEVTLPDECRTGVVDTSGTTVAS